MRDFIARFETERFGDAPVGKTAKAQATRAVKKAQARRRRQGGVAAKKTRAPAVAAKAAPAKSRKTVKVGAATKG